MLKKHKVKLKRVAGNVEFKHMISGVVEPACSPVQVYILANDNKWYLQKPVEAEGKHFTCDCSFGFENSFDHEFNAVALITADRPASPVDSLPEDVVKSKPIRVKRSDKN